MGHSICEQLPNDWEIRPPDIDEMPEGICVISCDAGYKNGIAGICALIKTSEKEYKPKGLSRRSQGPIHAELLAIDSAIKRFSSIRKPIKVCIIYTDSLKAYSFVECGWTPKLDYIQEVMNKIKTNIYKLNRRGIEIIIRHTSSKNIKRIDKRADKRRKAEENRKSKQISERISEVERAIIRSKEITICESNGEYFAMTKGKGFPLGYKVSIAPLNCECPWWRNNWGNKEQRIIYARAKPCKHICALAEYLNKDVYQLFRLQIRRID